jgi:PPM family protein phosphatase
VISFDQFEHASLSDVGVRRSHNQDNHAMSLATDEEQWQSRGHLFLVADGMGAHAVGEKASEQAVHVIPHILFKSFQQGAATALRKAFVEANAHIHACGEANREFHRMGTTATGLLLRPEGAWIGHVGDSRCYRIRNGSIEQLSYDHSLLWESARMKGLDPDEVTDIPSHVIYRCLGPEAAVTIDVEGPHPLKPNDIFLLCSDGLSGQVSDVELAVVASLLAPVEACRFLVDLANLRGGPDNITVLIIKIKPGETIEEETVAPPVESAGWPWWVPTLVGGTLLAAAAAYMASEHMKGTLVMLVLGAGAILAGLGGLFLHYLDNPEKEEEQDEDQPKPRIHRRKTFQLQQHFLDQLSQDLETLREQADAKKADVDWATFQVHHTLGNQLSTQGNLPAAFREYCLSMIPLSRAFQRLRNKEETFMPRWDKRK